MSNEIAPIGNDKQDAFSRIHRFYDKRDIVLTADEEEILKRWDFADNLMLQGKFRSAQIVEKIRDRFSVSVYTAQSDMKNAQALFGLLRVLNKNYQIALAIEELKVDIERARLDKSLAPTLPKLRAELTKLLKEIPDEQIKETEPVPNITFNIVDGQQGTVGGMTFEQAKELLQQKKQLQQQNSVEDIDYEDVKD